VKGEGVLVGIIDSGIDYLHPALGGGIGPAFKVVGGYDFVNGDPDPMDDNGHGTHVAGIVAADGVLFQGVAPKARILAYKVLNASGQGSDWDVIAALERSVDPNQDGDPSDMPDILNMSLGSDFGDPDDPVSTAVDNAVRLGMTICVAAGNAGGYTPVQGKEQNYYFTGMETVASPGTARLAITVGAVDSLDRLAQYSSKGPSAGIFAIKPDVVAPGDGIWSLAPGGGMIQHSGTSMASPVVAGVAALLKSKDRSMSPAAVRSAIMNSSVDLGLSVFKQGAGRIDPVRALTTTTLINPGHLSYGLDDPSQLTWTKVETLSVFNANAASQSYLLSVSGSVPGVDLTVLPAAFTIPSGASGDVSNLVELWS
jgi:subtilisin family serine protease